MMDILQPYLTEIVQALLGIIATLVIAMLIELRERVLKWIDTHTSAKQRELLHTLAAEAYAHVEKYLQDQGGAQKLNAAVDYVLHALGADRIGVSRSDVMGAVQKAWQDANPGK